MWGMQKILLVMVAVALVGCGGRKEEGDAKSETVMGVEPDTSIKPLITDPIVEKAIRKQLKKPTGKLTKADLKARRASLDLSDNNLTELPKGLEKLPRLKSLFLDDNKLTNVKGLEKLTELTGLSLQSNQLTDVKGLENLTGLTSLVLFNNPALTKAQIDQLQKALPNCKIISNAKK